MVKAKRKNEIEEHTDKYLHVPKVVGYLFIPVYVPLYWAFILVTMTLAFIGLFALTLFMMVTSLFDADLFGLSYQPNLEEVKQNLFWFIEDNFGVTAERPDEE